MLGPHLGDGIASAIEETESRRVGSSGCVVRRRSGIQETCSCPSRWSGRLVGSRLLETVARRLGQNT